MSFSLAEILHGIADLEFELCEELGQDGYMYVAFNIITAKRVAVFNAMMDGYALVSHMAHLDGYWEEVHDEELRRITGHVLMQMQYDLMFDLDFIRWLRANPPRAFPVEDIYTREA